MPTTSVFDGLHPAWRAAFDEAWGSAQRGNFGVGAVLVDPVSDLVVARGRNRVVESPAIAGVLAGNMTAHAEMNAFAALDRFNAEGLHLYTTLEPCLMCAAAAMQLKVTHVHYAVADEFYDDLDDVWSRHPVTAQRRPERTGPLDGDHDVLSDLGRLLPMLFTLDRFAGRTAERLARERHPWLASFADELLGDQRRFAAWLALDLDDALDVLRGRGNV